MKIGIFYWSLQQNNDGDRQIVACPEASGFVRMEVVEANSLSAGLDLATPAEDEHVMNSHYVDKTDESRDE